MLDQTATPNVRYQRVTRVSNSEIRTLLAGFGIEEPVLSELSSDGLTPELVRAWILYIQTQDLERPAGYLVNRLRAGQAPADVWMTLGRLSEDIRRPVQLRVVAIPITEIEATSRQ